MSFQVFLVLVIGVAQLREFTPVLFLAAGLTAFFTTILASLVTRHGLFLTSKDWV
jgi:hypothetical protein